MHKQSAIDRRSTESLLQGVARLASEYQASLIDRPVYPKPEAVQALHQFEEPLPEVGVGAEAALNMLAQIGTNATVASAGPRYYGFVIGGAFPVATAANWLATAWDQCAGAVAMSPLAAKIEAVTAKWIPELLDLPRHSAVGFVTGSTTAHIAALTAARKNRYSLLGWDVDRMGLVGAPQVKIVATGDLHTSLVKALGIVGFGRESLRRVPVDNQGRMDVRQLGAIDRDTIVICQAGNVNSGAFDAIGEIADIVESAGAWLHVDGAFGALARVSPKYRHLAAGLERADSMSCSAHKLFNVPYDSALVICRRPEDLEGALAIETSYAVKSQDREPNHFTLEGSRRARGVDVWSVLKSLGSSGLAKHVESCCRNAHGFAELLQSGGLTISNEVSFNQVLIEVGDRATRDRLLDAVQRDGTCWIGPAQWFGKAICRASFCNWSTTHEDVRASATAILDAWRSVKT